MDRRTLMRRAGLAGACLLVLATVARAEGAEETGGPAAPAAPVTTQAPPVEPVAVEPPARPIVVPPGCQGSVVQDARWFDRAQGYFSQQTCTPAVWFDRFFGDEREDDVASALLRIIPQLQYSDRDFTDYTTRLRARISLPRLKDRFSIVVNEDDDTRQGLLPGEATRPAEDAAQHRTENSAAIRYLVRLAGQSGADFDVGLRAQLKFLARARYYRTWTLAPTLQTRFTETLSFLDGEGWGETSLVEVERMVAADMLVRLGSQFTVAQVVNGLEWREGVQLYRQIDRNRAISWNVAMQVDSDPAWQATGYFTSVRYRQRIFRPWFYYEVEPFMDWIRADRFNSNPGIAFRVEVWVGDTSPPKSSAAARHAHPPAMAPATALPPAALPPAPVDAVTETPTSPTSDVVPGEP